MARGFNGTIMRLARAGEWEFEVTDIDDLTPHYRRIRFSTPGFFEAFGETEGQVSFGPSSYVRFWAPDLDDPDRQHQRAYTVVESDPVAEEITIDVVLHEPAGPASAWAAAAEVGSTMAATRFGIEEFTPPTPAPTGYLLVGDMASLPAMSSIVAELPPEVPVEMFVEYVHDDDRTIPVAEHPRLTTTWVRRTPDSEALAAALSAAHTERPAAWNGWYAWVAAEKHATKQVRGKLKEWGFPGSATKARAYWAAGKNMGKSRDTGDIGELDTPMVEGAAEEAAPGDAEGAAGASVTPAASGAWAATGRQELLAPVKGALRIAGVVQVLVSLLELAPFLVLVELCRRLLAGDTDDLMGLAFWALGLMGAASFLTLVLTLALHLVDARFGHQLRVRMVRHLSRVPLGWFDDRSSARVRKAVQDDAAATHYLVTHAVLDLVGAVVVPLTVLVYLFVVHAGLAGVMLLPLFAYYVLTLRMYAVAMDGIPKFERLKERVGDETIAFAEGAEVARVYDRGASGRLRRVLDERAAFLRSWQGPLVGIKALIDLVTRPTTTLLLISSVGGLFVFLDWMSPGDLVAFLLVGVTFGSRLLAIAYGFQGLKESNDAAGRIGLLLAEPTLTDGEASLPEVSGAVRFASVTFGYRADRPVLRDFDLALEPGTVTAVVGPSGAGKSTVAALLARFHDVDRGAVSIDGVDVRDLPQHELYRRVGFVFQGASGLRASVHDNIALGRPEATRGEVETVARAAQLHDRIAREPQGYDAVIGRDTWLSGGEFQRLAIARTLLADPAILVLDEATASADPESEHLVQQAISELVAGRTLLVIAHRLHTVTGADRIVVMADGQIVQDGTHVELAGVEGLYADLWSASSRTVAAAVEVSS